MAYRVYKIAGAAVATANAIASIQVTKGGRIRMVQWGVQADLDADGELFAIELSTAPYDQTQVNDTLGPVCGLQAQAAGAAAGLCAFNLAVPMAFAVGTGERLYVNAFLFGTADVRFNCYIHFEEGA